MLIYIYAFEIRDLRETFLLLCFLCVVVVVFHFFVLVFFLISVVFFFVCWLLSFPRCIGAIVFSYFCCLFDVGCGCCFVISYQFLIYIFVVFSLCFGFASICDVVILLLFGFSLVHVGGFFSFVCSS